MIISLLTDDEDDDEEEDEEEEDVIAPPQLLTSSSSSSSLSSRKRISGIDPGLRNLNLSTIDPQTRMCTRSIQVDLLKYHTSEPVTTRKKPTAKAAAAAKAKKGGKKEKKKTREYKNKHTVYDYGMMVHSCVNDLVQRGYLHSGHDIVIERTNNYEKAIKLITVMLFHLLGEKFGFDHVFYSDAGAMRRHHGLTVKKKRGESKEEVYLRRKEKSIESAGESIIRSKSDMSRIKSVLKKTNSKKDAEDGADALEAIFHAIHYHKDPSRFKPNAPMKQNVIHPTCENIKLSY